MLPPLHPRSADQRTAFTDSEYRAAFPRESEHVERKTGTGARPLQEVLVAFSNSGGGVLLIGAKDDGAIVGRQLSGGVEQAVHEAAGAARNVSSYRLHELRVGGSSLVAVAVVGKETGAAQTSDGRVLVRRGARNVALFDEQLLRFLQSRSRERFESSDSGTGIQDADPVRRSELRTLYGWSRDEERARLEERGLLRSNDDRLTVAGALLLTDPLPDRFAKAVIEVRRHPDDGVDYDRRVDIAGPVDRQIREAVSFVSAELGTELVVSGLYRYELPRLPEKVLREAIANAVAHRSYEDSGSAIVVELRPGVVRVISPGPLPAGVTIENLRTAQAARNVNLIAVLRRMNLAEDAGRGIDEIEDGMAGALLEAPSFDDNGRSVVAELPTRAIATLQERAWIVELERRRLLEPSDKLLLVRSARGELLTNGAVRALLGVDSREARALLRRLRDAGVLRQHGERGGASYALEEAFAPSERTRLDDEAADRVILRDAGHRPLSNADVRNLLGVDAVGAKRRLDDMVVRGLLRRTGRARGTRYVAARPLTPT